MVAEFKQRVGGSTAVCASTSARVTTGAAGVLFGGGAAEAADPMASTPMVRDAAAAAATKVMGRVIVDSIHPGSGDGARSASI